MRTHLRALFIVAALVAIAACGEADPSGAPPGGGLASLAGSSWNVVSVAGRSPVPNAVPTLEFNVDRVTGSGGCNHIGGRYRFDGATGRLAFDELGGTAMGCLEAGVGDYETVFLRALGSATEAGLDPAGQLILNGAAGRIVLVTVGPPAAGG